MKSIIYSIFLVIVMATLVTPHMEVQAGQEHATQLAKAEKLYNQGLSFFEQNNYVKAEQLYQRSLVILEKLPYDGTITGVLNNLAMLYYAQGDYVKAERLFQRSLAILEKSLEPDDLAIASVLRNLSALYEVQGDDGKAKSLMRRAMAIENNQAVENDDDKEVATVNIDVSQEAKWAEAIALDEQADTLGTQGFTEVAMQDIKRSLAIKKNIFGPKHSAIAVSFTHLASLYSDQKNYASAEKVLQRALAIMENFSDTDDNKNITAGIINNLGMLYSYQGNYVKAKPLLQRSLAMFENILGPNHLDVAVGLNNLATLYQLQGDYAHASPLLQRSLTISENILGTSDIGLADTINNLAALHHMQGNYAQAEPLYKRALAIKEDAYGSKHPFVAHGYEQLANLYTYQGKYAKAEQLYKRALAIREDRPGATNLDIAGTFAGMSAVYYEQGKYALSLEYSRKSNHIYRDRILNNSHIATGRGNNEHKEFKHHFAAHLPIATARMAEFPKLRYELTAESFEIGQLIHDGSVGDALAKMAARFASGSDKLANLARKKEDTQIAWQKMDADLIIAIGKPPAEQNPALLQNLRAGEQEFEQKLHALNLRLEKEFPSYVELTIPKPVGLLQTQQLLQPNEALIAYVFTKKETIETNTKIYDWQNKSFVWQITPNSASFRQLDRSATDIDKQVQTLRATLSPDDNKALKTAFPVDVAYSLYKDILGPEAARLTGVKTLFVVADGALESLPFSVLVTAPSTSSSTDYQKVAWLSRKLATVTLPTVSSLRALRVLANKGQAANQPFVGFGDPNFSGTAGGTRGVGGVRLTKQLTATSSGLADPTRLREVLPPLPETADELRAIAQTLGANDNNIYLQNQASVTTVNATDLSQYRVVDFATHALVAGQVEEYKLGNVEPAIALTPPPVATVQDDGLLRASQVAQLKLNADWVVLSACNTAAADGSTGAVGLSGLAKAFFYAGARALLVSHWSVLSKPAVTLTTTMFKTWQDNPQLGRAEALRQAQMQMLDHPEKPYFTHPASWAAFVVAGEGGIGK